VSTIEDMQWHDVRVDVDGENVRVWLDGTLIIDGDIPGLFQKGGYIGFTGTTGAYTNHHRFDNLEVVEVCD
jgi:hypothetical protein